MRTIMWILWPSFLAAGFASGVVFALVDPRDIPLFGYIRISSELAYAAGFFLFWLTAAFSSTLSFFMSSSGNNLSLFSRNTEQED
ncbi:hypothetical protein [Advenella mimigardefordensis]|uniref:hypothetical protein n=1 Tax=Advenella mimigardefordensis TaxID=302406 RepID=UPI00046D396A|nr:hypothetical protein [Advenella mimigardefordensis]